MRQNEVPPTERLSEEEIDVLVEAQALDALAWGPPQRVRRGDATSVAIPAELAARAAFLARLHRTSRLEDWLTRIIRERIEIEEVAFATAKRELATSSR